MPVTPTDANPPLSTIAVHSPTVRMGGYPRFWRHDGTHWDGAEIVPDEAVAELEARWREAHVRIEWLTSRHGRLDRALPQTLERLAHNQNVRSWAERGRSVERT